LNLWRNNITTGPNGLIERQVTKELLDLFNIDETELCERSRASVNETAIP